MMKRWKSAWRGSCVAAACALSFAWATAAGAERTVDCGESYAGHAELIGDCTGDVTIYGGSLNLRGFTLRGTVYCQGDSCKVYSDPPEGALSGYGEAGSIGVAAAGRSVVLEGIAVTGFATGVAAGDVSATDVVIAANTGFGVNASGRIEVANSEITLNGNDGLHSQIGAVVVSGSEISGNGGNGIRALKGVEVTDSRIVGSGGDGVQNFSEAVVITRSIVSDNGLHGVRTDDSDCTPMGVLRLGDATVENNARDSSCGEERACADVTACSLPRVIGSSHCETSYRIQSGVPGESWRICQLD